MCPKRRQNLHLAIDQNKHSVDEQSVVQDYMVFQNVLRHCEKFDVFGARLYRGCIKPESYNFKGVTEWSFAR